MKKRYLYGDLIKRLYWLTQIPTAILSLYSRFLLNRITNRKSVRSFDCAQDKLPRSVQLNEER